MNTNPDIVRVYYCYDKADDELRRQLDKHLSPLRNERKLTIWLDVQILPGSDWQLEVEKQLQEADLILLLVSPDFMASDYCYKLQLTAALNHYEAGKVTIVPIILRPVLWEDTHIKRLPLILPDKQLPITRWPDRDEAFLNVAAAIRDLVQAKLTSKRPLPGDESALFSQLGEAVLTTRCPQCGTLNRIGAKFCSKDGVDLLNNQMILVPKAMPSQKTREEWVKDGQLFAEQRLHADALAAYDQALQIDARYATAYFYKGHVLYGLQQYTPALSAYEQAARFDPDATAPHCHRGHTLRHLKRYSEALMAYELALQAGTPTVSAVAWNGKGRVLADLKRYPEALIAYEQALLLNPHYAETYVNRGNAFHELKQYSEALATFEQAALLQPGYTAPYFYKGNVLIDLKRYSEALVAYEQALRLDPYYVAAYHGQGRVYEMLGLAKEAQEAFAKVASLNARVQVER